MGGESEVKARDKPLDYPTMDLRIDRERAGQLGVTVEQIGKALLAATSSSRYIQPTYWRDPNTGIAFQVQVEVPQARIASVEDVEKTMLQEALDKARGNVSEAARLLKITRNTLRYRMGKYNITVPEESA